MTTIRTTTGRRIPAERYERWDLQDYLGDYWTEYDLVAIESAATARGVDGNLYWLPEYVSHEPDSAEARALMDLCDRYAR